MNKKDMLCKCGCNQEIIIQRHHKWHSHGIPDFIHGHNRKGTGFTPRETGGLCACGCGRKIVQKRKCRIPIFMIGHHTRIRTKGLKLEDIYGIEKAREISGNMSISRKGKPTSKKGKKYGHRVPREIRVCKCGCNENFKCKISSRKRYILGHHLIGKPSINKGIKRSLLLNQLSRKRMLTLWQNVDYRKRQRESHLGYKSKVKGKTYEEIHGKEDAEKLKKKLIVKHTGKKGNLSSNWQGGKSFELYGLEFNKKLKQKIKERDGYKCQECGVSGMESRLVCHHIDYNKKNNKEDNLIILCNACNLRVNGNRTKWTEWFKFKMLKEIKIIDSIENSAISSTRLDDIADDRNE